MKFADYKKRDFKLNNVDQIDVGFFYWKIVSLRPLLELFRRGCFEFGRANSVALNQIAHRVDGLNLWPNCSGVLVR